MIQMLKERLRSKGVAIGAMLTFALLTAMAFWQVSGWGAAGPLPAPMFWLALNGFVVILWFQRNSLRAQVQERTRELQLQYDALSEKDARLSVSEEQFRTVVTNTPIIIYAIDTEGVFTLSEGLGLRKLGLQSGEVVGKSALDLYRDYPDITDGIRRALAGEAVFLEHVVGGIYFDNRLVPVFDETGQVKAVIGSALDISERITVEECLQKSYRDLSSAHGALAVSKRELREQYVVLAGHEEEIRQQNMILASLHNTALGLLDRLDLDEVLTAIVDKATELIGTSNGFICLVDKEHNLFDRKVGVGCYKADVGRAVNMNDGLCSLTYKTGKIQLIEDYHAWEGRIKDKFFDQIHSTVQVPLKWGGEVIGIFGLSFTAEDGRFTPQHISLLERFAELASIAVVNARLYTSLAESEKKLYESHEELTAAHEELTASHEELLANEEELRHMYSEVVDTNIKLEESHHTIEEIFNAANDVFVVCDVATGDIVTVNRQASILFGYSVAEFKSIGLRAIMPDHAEDALGRIRDTAAVGQQMFERETRDRYGRRIVLEVKTSPAVIHGKTCCLALIRDITARRQMEQELVRSQNQKLATFSAIPDLIVLLGREGVHLDHNTPPGFVYFPEKSVVTGEAVTDVFPPDIAAGLLACIAQVLDSGETQYYEFGWEIDGVEFSREVRFVRVDQDKALALFRDTTEKRKLEARLEFLSLHDSLTGAYNRAYFEERTLQLQSEKHIGVGVFVCDVDGLKLINDTVGHRHGDELLRKVALLLDGYIEEPDFVARIGGDEFAVVVYQPTKERMEALEKRYKEAVASYNEEMPQLPLSLSFGWAADATGAHFDQIFKAADNNMYRQKMHQSHSVRSAIVQIMMKALEARDHITEGHADRLGYLMERMGQKLRLPQGAVADLRLLAKFHDIGKVGIPDGILNKPGRLTEEEMVVMRRHCEIGFRIAQASSELAPIADWILKHQEHWDGNGYPLGIAGEEIPLECRILGIIDAYDAMTSDRPYRKAVSHQEAVAEIRRCSGTQFDPEITKVFLEMVNQGPFFEQQ